MKMTGTVYIDQTQEAIPAVNISLIDSTTQSPIEGTPVIQSDASGNYSIDIPDDEEACKKMLVAFRKSGFAGIGIKPSNNMDVFLVSKTKTQPSQPALSASGQNSTMQTLPADIEKKNYKPYIIAAAVLLTIAVSVWVYLKYRKKSLSPSAPVMTPVQ